MNHRAVAGPDTRSSIRLAKSSASSGATRPFSTIWRTVRSISSGVATSFMASLITRRFTSMPPLVGSVGSLSSSSCTEFHTPGANTGIAGGISTVSVGSSSVVRRTRACARVGAPHSTHPSARIVGVTYGSRIFSGNRSRSFCANSGRIATSSTSLTSREKSDPPTGEKPTVSSLTARVKATYTTLALSTAACSVIFR